MILTGYFTFVCALLVLAPGGLRAAPGTPDEDNLFIGAEPSSACPQLFGDEETRERNRRHRKELLLSVRRGRYCHVVLHSAQWKDPQPVDYVGLSLLRTRIDAESGPQALVSVSGEIAELDCAPGLYLIGIDDSIGEEARILAILREAILIEDGQELKYIKSEGAPSPVWRMIWKSSWSMPRLPDSSRKVRYPSSRRRKHTRPPGQRRRR